MPVNEVQASNVAAIHILTSNIIPPKYVDYIVSNRVCLPLYIVQSSGEYIANFVMF